MTERKSEGFLVDDFLRRPVTTPDFPRYYEYPEPREVPSLDAYFIQMLPAIAARSKDPRNQVGAIIVGDKGEIRSTGFNGFPRKVKELPERWDRMGGEKYRWVIHAEINAIINAARVGTPIEGTSIYVSFLPCIDCAKAVINAGIKRVIVDDRNHLRVAAQSKYFADIGWVKTILSEGEVQLDWYEETE
jgi:dCMP deaminase